MEDSLMIQAEIRAESEIQKEALQDLRNWEIAIKSRNTKATIECEKSFYGIYNLEDEDEENTLESEAQYCEDNERLRGNKLFADCQFEKAIECYTQCITMNPNSGVAYSNRAMAQLKLKNWDAAIHDATNAIQLDEKNSKAYQRRATAYLAQGKIRAALRDLTHVDPISKQHEKAQKALQDAVQSAPKRKVKITFN